MLISNANEQQRLIVIIEVNSRQAILFPTSCRVLTLLPSTDKVELISTSRHITQGWVDLLGLNRNDTTNSYTGKSNVVKNDAYELRFVFPRGKNFRIKSATARGALAKVFR